MISHPVSPEPLAPASLDPACARGDRDSRPVLGILGGMGPAAGAEFFRLFTALWPAPSDQHHPQVVLLSEPGIPDRTAALASGSSAPEAAIRSALEFLVASGANLLAVPCNTAFAFIDRFAHEIPVPIVDTVGVAVTAARKAAPAGSTLLATEGTVRAGLYQRRAAMTGYTLRTPEASIQSLVNAAIHAVKSGERARARAVLDPVRRSLGRHPAVLGCTELALAWETTGIETCSLHALAGVCVQRLSEARPRKETAAWTDVTR